MLLVDIITTLFYIEDIAPHLVTTKVSFPKFICRGDGSGGPGGHRGAQSILITSSESVTSYSIVTWC